jgi:hypothetical protein
MAHARCSSVRPMEARERQVHAFQGENAALTLAQGLAEYYAASPWLKRGAELAEPARTFFACHDAVHVVFGCDTSLTQEAVVKLRSILGTTAGFSVLRGYALYESLDIYRTLKPREILVTIVTSMGIVPRTILRCAQQTKRWPWDGYHEYLDVPLYDIRQAFGIRL